MSIQSRRKKKNLSLGSLLDDDSPATDLPADAPVVDAGPSMAGGCPDDIITDAGTWKEGDFKLNTRGLQIGDGKTVASSSEDGKEAHIILEDDTVVFLSELESLGEVGRGAGGRVDKVVHEKTGRVFARKVVNLELDDRMRKHIILELRTLYESATSNIVKFFGAFYQDGSIIVILEYMDAGSVAHLAKVTGSFPEPVLADMCEQVLRGLKYLHHDRHLMHRDIKPGNLLVDRDGICKIADFGVSSQMDGTLASANSWVGTVTYMSPERIQNQSYSFPADIWSLGLTILELGIGRYPYPPEGTENAEDLQFWDILHYITSMPSPTMPADKFSPELCDFVAKMLNKDPTERLTASALLQHPFIKKHKGQDSGIADFVAAAVDMN